jgi:hypothetical protein
VKVALCISGQPRFFRKSYEFLYNNFIRLNDVDVFLHTWEYSDEHKDKPFDSASWNVNNSDVYLGHEETVKQLTELYKPKLFKTSKLQEITVKNWQSFPLTNGENLSEITHKMFFTIMESVKLVEKYSKENNLSYDVIVRTRYDAAPLSEIIIERIDKETVYHTDSCRNPNVLSDWFFWASTQHMYNLCHVYEDIDDFVFRENVMCCGEELLTHKINKMCLKRKPISKSLCLVRDNEFSNKTFGKIF